MSSDSHLVALEDEVQLLRRQVSALQAKCARLERACGAPSAGARGDLQGEQDPAGDAPSAAAPAAAAAPPAADAGAGAAGALGPYSPAFQRAAAKLFDAHMGAENMGPLLYAVVRFAKPRSVLEIGSGYTSIWILQALADNARELAAVRAADAGSPVPGVPWYVPAALEGPPPKLHSVDNLEHGHTTAHRVAEVAEELGVAGHLELHVADAFEIFAGGGAAGRLAALRWDLLWFDGISACAEWPAFFREAWGRLSDRGLALVHSSLTNATTRAWLSSVAEDAAAEGPWVSFEVAPAGEPAGGLGALAARVREALPGYTWRHEARAGGLAFRVALPPGCDAFEEGLALADEVAGVEGVGAVTNVLPAKRWLEALHHVGLLEPHKRMQNSVSMLQKRAAGADLSEPVFSYLP